MLARPLERVVRIAQDALQLSNDQAWADADIACESLPVFDQNPVGIAFSTDAEGQIVPVRKPWTERERENLFEVEVVRRRSRYPLEGCVGVAYVDAGRR
jgi:hypothetical protein